MTGLVSIVLYAVGSPLVVEVEESCRRAGVEVVGAVRNVDGPHHLLNAAVLRELTDIDTDLLRFPCIVPLFTPARRHKAAAEAAARGFATADALIDPTAVIASSTALGPGSYVNAGAVIGAAGRFGRHVIVNRAASVGHHAEIGDLVSIGPGVTVAGMVKIGAGAMIGAGAVILPEISIGSGCVVGAGAVVTRDVPPGMLALGNPARVIRDVPPDEGGGSSGQRQHG